jgi:hypothetical protein
LENPLDAATVGRIVAALDDLGAREAAQAAAAEHLSVIEACANDELREFLLATLDLATAR